MPDSNNGMASDGNHFSGTYNSDTLIVIICSALALFNSIELELLIFTTFHTFRGLYFWSLVIASFGIIPYVLGFLIEYFRLSWMALGISIDTIGWCLVVTGQSVVLYSRLWLVFGRSHYRLLKAVKWMIIVDGIIFHGSTAVVVYGSHYGRNRIPFEQAYNFIERIQMVGFCLQEFILSGLYIWKALDIIKTSHQKRSHHVMWQLLSINVIIILLDIGLLVVEFLSYHVAQQTLKGVIYSVKLKLEFAVLNKLVEISTNNSARAIAHSNTGESLDPKTVWDATRFTSEFSSGTRDLPRWVSDLEKARLQPMTSDYTLTETSWTRSRFSGPIPMDGIESFSDATHPASALLDPRLDPRERRSDTDVLYAEAMRTIAASSRTTK